MSAQPWESIVNQVDKRLESLDRGLEGFRGEVGRRFDTFDRKFDTLMWGIFGSWLTLMLAIFFRHG